MLTHLLPSIPRTFLTVILLLVCLSLVVVYALVSSSHIRSTFAAPGSLNPLVPVLFFDGSTDPRFFNAVFGEPSIDSQGRLLLASSHFSTSCTGACGVRLNSIGPTGVLNWQTPNDNSFVTNDLLFSGVPVTVAPSDRVYVQGRTTIYAFEPIGTPVTGWPVDVIPTNSLGPSRFSAYAGNSGLTIDSDGTLYAKTGVYFSFNGFPTTVVALRPDGSLKWRKDYDEGGLDWGIIQGPGGNIFTIESSGAGQRFVGIDRTLGTEYCQYSSNGILNPLLAYSNSFVGGSSGVFTSFQSNVRAFDQNCNSGIIFTSLSPEVFLYTFADNKIFGYTYPAGSLDLSQLRITAISNTGSSLWRNETILPQGNPVHADKNGVLYVLGQDTTDANKPKLFLLDDSTGAILNAMETSSICGGCGVAVAPDGSIYVNDLGSTRIYKITSTASDIIPYQSSGYRYQTIGNTDPPPAGFEQPAYDDSAWSVGTAAFGFSQGYCAIQNTDHTLWPASTDLLIRRAFSLPDTTNSVRVNIAVDNDTVDVFFNGVRIASNLSHDECPQLDDFRFDVPQNLVMAGSNVVAYHLRDRGFESFFDTRIVAISGPSPTPTATPIPTPTPTPTATPNQTPVAGFTMSLGSKSATDGQTLQLTAPTAPVFVNFSANRSFDPDGTIAAWQWTVDGINASTASTFTYGLSIGNHTVSLVVTDNQGAASQQAIGFVSITALRSLKLFAINDGDDRPLDIRAENVQISLNGISADVVITNLSDTWFESDIEFDVPTVGAPSPVSDNQIPFNFLIGPMGSVRFRAVFQEGQYLHYKVTRTTSAAFLMLAIDMIGRGLLGVELALPKGQLDLALGDIAALIGQMNATCGGSLFELGLCIKDASLLCVVSKLASFIHCAVTNPAFKQLITRLYGNGAVRQWVAFGSRDVLQIALDILSFFDRAPKVAVLYDATIHAKVDSFVRLEARR